ncbi:MAG TPA: MlaD family protein [Longimicrobium sp.]|nr:MlaD family protein [Longimicrobium sp.]
MAPMRSPRREVHVGLFVIVGLLAVIAVLFTITDPGTFRGRYYVSTVVRDAGGIRKGDPVRLKGVNIGRVREFRISEGVVRITLELEHEYPVPADSRVSIVSSGIMQPMVAEIIPGESRQPLADGQVLQSIDAPTFAQQAERLGSQAEALGTRADTVLFRAQQVLSEQTVAAVGTSAQEMAALLAQLTQLASEQRTQLGALTASLRRSAEGFESSATRPELARAIARADSLTLKLDAATTSLAQAGTSLAALAGRVERGEGTLGKLAQDDQLYDNLNAAVTGLMQLTQDIRENPRKYINVRVF